MRDQIFNELVEILNEKEFRAEYNREDTPVEEYGMDSIDRIEFIMEVEKHFNISISDEDAERFVTMGDVVSYVEERIRPRK